MPLKANFQIRTNAKVIAVGEKLEQNSDRSIVFRQKDINS